MMPNARLFDPEVIGMALAHNLADIPHTDFQDLAPWRPMVVDAIDHVAHLTGQDVIAVQTVLNGDYWIEICEGLTEQGHLVRKVTLDCDLEALRNRIQADGDEPDALSWRLDHVDAYSRVRDEVLANSHVVVTTDSISARKAAEVIWIEIRSRLT